MNTPGTLVHNIMHMQDGIRLFQNIQLHCWALILPQHIDKFRADTALKPPAGSAHPPDLDHMDSTGE
jgi:hypothetical protein